MAELPFTPYSNIIFLFIYLIFVVFIVFGFLFWGYSNHQIVNDTFLSTCTLRSGSVFVPRRTNLKSIILPSYENQSIDFHHNLIFRFLYDGIIGHKWLE